MYKTVVNYDTDSEVYYMIFPQELLEDLGIEQGDTLTWVVEEEKIYLMKNSS